MDCAVVADRSAAYLDQELSPGEREQLEEHLEKCEQCTHLLERLGAQDLGAPLELQGLADPALWKSMDDRLSVAWTRVQAERGEAPPLLARRVTVRVPLALAYAAILLLSLAWGWGNHLRAERAETSATAMSQQLEREQRLAAEPSEPVRVDGFSLVSYTPHRGTF